MPKKERRKKEKEQNALDEEDDIDDDASPTGGLTQQQMVEGPWKGVKNTLPWNGVDKKLQDLPVHPCVSRMWKELFDRENHTPAEADGCSKLRILLIDHKETAY
jgi:hypothetical protein